MLKKPFKEDSKIDAVFGETRSYGLHSGVDENGVGGGNTDCGYKLYPLKECTLVHSSTSTAGYGNIVVYKIVGEFGERWIRYCHCRELLMTAGEATQDTPIATLGTTGNSTACHLHWDVILKPMRNWRTYAKDTSTLNEYFEDPTAFFNKWKDIEDKEDMPDYFTKLLIENKLDLENEGQIREWFGKAKDSPVKDEKIQTLTDQVETGLETITTLTAQYSGLSSKVLELDEKVAGLEDSLAQTRSDRSEANEKAEYWERQHGFVEKENERLKENNNVYAYSWWSRFVSLLRKAR